MVVIDMLDSLNVSDVLGDDKLGIDVSDMLVDDVLEIINQLLLRNSHVVSINTTYVLDR